MGKTRSRAPAPDITLDTGALIALDRGDRRMIALLDQASAQRRHFRVPSGVVGQAWRNGRAQVALARFLRTEGIEIVPLDEHLARSCGELCVAAGTSDVIDASVVIVAKERGDVIVSSDIESQGRSCTRSLACGLRDWFSSSPEVRKTNDYCFPAGLVAVAEASAAALPTALAPASALGALAAALVAASVFAEAAAFAEVVALA